MSGRVDPQRSGAVKNWISEIDGKSFESSSLCQGLRSGVRLCEMINILFPGAVTKINKGTMPYHERENIANYISACQKLGVKLLFEVEDLYDGKNPTKVVNHFYSLSSTVKTSSKTYKGSSI